MTRINLVDPAVLVRQHLIAEYREAPRIFALVRAARARGETPEQARTLSPPAYTLGTGHCRFFYPRLRWLSRRYFLLVCEMEQRGYSPAFRELPDWAREIPADWFGAWEPTPACAALNVARINERLRGMGLSGAQLVLGAGGRYEQCGDSALADARLVC